jgi:hypothetical protein
MKVPRHVTGSIVSSAVGAVATVTGLPVYLTE